MKKHRPPGTGKTENAAFEKPKGYLESGSRKQRT